MVESLGFRRFVIGYDAGNLPHVEGGLGLLVPTGDVDALDDRGGVFARRVTEARTGGGLVLRDRFGGPLPEDEWSTRVGRHLEEYTWPPSSAGSCRSWGPPRRVPIRRVDDAMAVLA